MPIQTKSNAKVSATGRNAVFVATGIFLSRIFGFVRDRVFAHYLGNSDAAGAFRAAMRIPNLLQNLFGEGVLSASFIPVYSKLMAEAKHDDAKKLAGSVMALLTVSMCFLVAVGVLFSRPLIDLLAPGFSGDTRELTIRLVQILFPSSGLLVLSAWCLGVLNSHRKFFLSYAAPVVWNIAIIACLVFFGAKLSHTRLEQMELTELVALAAVVGSALQLFIQIPIAYKLNGALIFSNKFKSGEAHTVVRNFFPALFSRGVVQLSAYIDQIFSSFLGPATVAGVAYAQTLSLLPVSLFGMSVSSAELPELSSAVGTEEEIQQKLRERLQNGLLRISFYVIPSVMAFFALGDVVVGIVYQTGKFVRSDTVFVWWILAGATVGLYPSTQSRLCSSVFWALRDAKAPARFALLRMVLTAVLGYIATFPVREHFQLPPEHAAALLGACSGIAGWVEFLLIKFTLRQRIGSFRGNGPLLAKTWGAALAASLICFVVKQYLPFRPLLTGVPLLGLYAACYFGSGKLLGLPEVNSLYSLIKRRLS